MGTLKLSERLGLFPSHLPAATPPEEPGNHPGPEQQPGWRNGGRISPCGYLIPQETLSRGGGISPQDIDVADLPAVIPSPQIPGAALPEEGVIHQAYLAIIGIGDLNAGISAGGAVTEAPNGDGVCGRAARENFLE